MKLGKRWAYLGSLVAGVLLGLAFAVFWPRGILPLLAISFLLWWLFVALGMIRFSRPVATSIGFGMIGIAALVIYWDRPMESLAQNDDKVTFFIGFENPSAWVDLSYTSPEIRLDESENEWWWGSVKISGNRRQGDLEQVSLPLVLRIRLPKDAILVPPDDGGSAPCVPQPGAESMDLLCTLQPVAQGASFDLSMNFWWRPELPRLRLGEKYLRLLRLPPEEVAKGFPMANRDHPPPLLSVFVNSKRTEIRSGNPESYYSLLAGYSWRLDFPDGYGQQYVDLTLVNRQVRYFADQAPNLFALGGGLLLGLLVEPLSERRREVKSREGEGQGRGDRVSSYRNSQSAGPIRAARRRDRGRVKRRAHVAGLKGSYNRRRANGAFVLRRSPSDDK